MGRSIEFKFGESYASAGRRMMWHIMKYETQLEIQDGGRPSNFQWLNRYKSAAECSKLLVTEYDLVTADTPRKFKVKKSKVKVTA